jgi:XapX domain-containing protein
MSQVLPYIGSLAPGLVVGVIYGLVSVSSPAPPIIALLGLLGILTGGAAFRWFKRNPDIVQACLHARSFALHPPDRNGGKGDAT